VALRRLDKPHLKYPDLGSRRLAPQLCRHGLLQSPRAMKRIAFMARSGASRLPDCVVPAHFGQRILLEYQAHRCNLLSESHLSRIREPQHQLFPPRNKTVAFVAYDVLATIS